MALIIGLLLLPLIAGAVPNQVQKPGDTYLPFNPDEVVESEFLIDTNITYVPVHENQWSPAIAFDGTNYLVVWVNSTSVAADYIYGARVSQNGTVLDSAGIPISTILSYKSSPAVAFDGTNYLVVWEEYGGGTASYDIYGARVSQNGTVLDPNGIPISTAVNEQRFPAVAFDGTKFLVVWQDKRSGSWDIYGARVSRYGTIFDTLGIPISTAVNEQGSPAVAFDGDNYLVVWEDYRNNSDTSDIYGARVNQYGEVFDPDGIPISTAIGHQNAPAVAFNGDNYLVVWEDYRNNSDTSDIYGARMSRYGVLFDSSGIPISNLANRQLSPAITFDGTNYLVVWQDYRNNSDTSDIYGTRVTPEGTVLDSGGILISTARDRQNSPSVAFDGTNYLVVWEDRRRNVDVDIYGARVSQDGLVIDQNGIPISTAMVVNEQLSPAVAFDGTNYLVVWQDSRSGDGSDIYGTRVSPDGTVLDPNCIPIADAINFQGVPSVAFDGTNYLVVWEDNRRSYYPDIYGARVSQDGVVLDSAGIPISIKEKDQRKPAVAFDGTNYLVVWQDIGSGLYDIYGARVSQDGVVLDSAGIPISTAFGHQYAPAVAFDGTNYLVVWHDERNVPPFYDIYGARVGQDGTVLDPDGIAISRARWDQTAPAVAFDDTQNRVPDLSTNYLVVWADERGYSCDIYGARVSQDGTVLDPNGIPISTAAGGQDLPSVGFDGTNFLVVWEDSRSSGSSDIYCARVTPGGVVFDSGPVVRQEGRKAHLALGRGQGNRMFLVYSGWIGMIGNKTYNTFRIWGKMNPAPGVAERFQPTANGSRQTATIVRKVLKMDTVFGLGASVLIDVTGRKVMELKPGENDVRHIPPGVYFIRGGSSIERKVVITR